MIRERLKVMPEIFPIGRPAADGDVVDRQEFIRECTMRLADGQSVMIASPRRTGKSSVAGEIMRQLRGQEYGTAAVDLFYVTSIEELAVKLLSSLLENRTGTYQKTVRSLRGLQEWLNHTTWHAKLGDLELGLTLTAATLDPLVLLETAIKAAERLAQSQGRRMIILFDEFQEIERLGGESLAKRLRALFQQQRATAYLFLGSQPSLMKAIFADRRQAFYRFATLLPLPAIDDAAWKQYLTERFSAFGFTITPSALEWLLEKSGGHPYGVMNLAYNAYFLARVQNFPTISADLMFSAFRKTLDTLDPVYNALWIELHRIPHADAVLEAIIAQQSPYRLPLSKTVVSRALRALIRSSILEKGAERGQYHLIEPLFKEWVIQRE